MNRIIVILLSLTFSAFGANENKEAYYQKLAAHELAGITEYILSDKTRVDIFTETVAYEVDFARKWAEGIGQALHYSTMTSRDAGLILIIEKDSDEKYIERVLHIMKIKSLRLVLYVYDNRVKKLIEVK